VVSEIGKKIIYKLESAPISRFVLHTSNPNSAINFYKRLGVNFIRDTNYIGTRFVAAPNKSCVFELYISGDSKVQNPSPLCLIVSDLEAKLESLGVDAQRQEDGSYAILDPDSRVLRLIGPSEE